MSAYCSYLSNPYACWIWIINVVVMMFYVHEGLLSRLNKLSNYFKVLLGR
jgi:hypothetical protein